MRRINAVGGGGGNCPPLGGAPDVVGMRTCCKNYSTIGVNIVYCDKCSSVRLTAEGAAASETVMVLQVS